MTTPVLAEKRCRTCGETKPLSEYHLHSDGRVWNECKLCQRERTARNAARRRAEMGDDAWLARLRDRQRARRTVTDRSKPGEQAYTAATARLRELHRDEFDAILRAERYERGLPL